MSIRNILTAILFFFPLSILATEEEGLKVAFGYILDSQSVVKGGLERGNVTLGNGVFEANLDLEKKFGFAPSRVFASAIFSHGGTPTSIVGDLQATSNIDVGGVSFIAPYEIYYEKKLGWFSLLAGLRDLSLDMNVNAPALFFSHSSPGTSAELGASGVLGPNIFPFVGPVIRLFWAGPNETYAFAAVADGVPGDPASPYKKHLKIGKNEGAFSVGEYGVASVDQFKFAAGAWSYSKEQPVISDEDEGKTAKSQGYYLMADYKFSEQFYPFARFGATGGKVQAIEKNLVVGFIGQNPWRENDTYGLMVSAAYLGGNYLDVNPGFKSEETAYEASYLFFLAKNIQLMPHLQYVQNPSGDPSIDDAVVLGLRLYASVGIY